MRRLAALLAVLAALAQTAPAQTADDAPLTDADVAEIAQMLDQLVTGSGDYAKAEELALQAQGPILTTFGAESREAVEIARILTMTATLQGRPEEGMAIGRQGVETGLRVIAGDDPLIYRMVAAYAVALRAQGLAPDALSLVSQALAEADTRLPADALAGDELRLVQATLAAETGDLDTAAAAFARLDERLSGRTDPEALGLRAISLIGWADLQVQAGDSAAAISTLQQAIGALDAQFAGLTHPRMVPVRLSATAQLAALLVQVGQADQVGPLVRPLMDEVAAVYGPDSALWADLAWPLSVALAGPDPGGPGAAEATALLQRVVDNWAVIYGPDTLDLMRARMSLAVLLASRGDLPGAMAQIDGLQGNALPEMRSQLTYVLHEAQVAGRLSADQAVEAVLHLMQDTQSQGAAAAQRLLSERLAAGSTAAAAALRARTDARGRLRADQAALATLTAQPLDQRDPALVDQARAAVKADQAALDAAEETIARDFPRLAQATGSAPLSLADIRSRLGPDQALVVLAPPTGPQDAGLVIAVSREAVDWHTFQSDAPEVEAAVTRLRAGIEMRLGLRSAAALDDADTPAAPAGFDNDAAYWLYTQTLGQVEGVIGTKRHLWLDLRGVMTELPPQLMQTAPAPDADPAHAAWTIRRWSFAVLPAISGLPRPADAPPLPPGKGLMAFADPALDQLGGPSGPRLAPLPETAAEAADVAAALALPDSQLLTGAGASEAAVKTAPLAQAGLLYFATHGLVAGDQVGEAVLDEPALALSPGGGQDGFLTASDIAELPLNARFVVLSACNTAAGDTPGAEALSGLAQSFLYAGARSLLVSHWPVDSRSAVALMTDLFRRSAATPGLPAAEAQRQAMLAMIDHPASPRWSHPAYWAPFVLVGTPD